MSSSVVPAAQGWPAHVVPPPGTYCPGEHTTHASVVDSAAVPAGHAAQTRSEVGVGGVNVACPSGQLDANWHTRSVVAVGAMYSNCESLHTVVLRQRALDVGVGATSWYCRALHVE